MALSLFGSLYVAGIARFDFRDTPCAHQDEAANTSIEKPTVKILRRILSAPRKSLMDSITRYTQSRCFMLAENREAAPFCWFAVARLSAHLQ
jgi:hypothetical protein